MFSQILFWGPKNISLRIPVLYNFQIIKSAVEQNSRLLKFFCYVTWFDRRRKRRLCKRGSLEDKSKRFIVNITETYYLTLCISKQTNILR